MSPLLSRDCSGTSNFENGDIGALSSWSTTTGVYPTRMPALYWAARASWIACNGFIEGTRMGVAVSPCCPGGLGFADGTGPRILYDFEGPLPMTVSFPWRQIAVKGPRTRTLAFRHCGCCAGACTDSSTGTAAVLPGRLAGTVLHTPHDLEAPLPLASWLLPARIAFNGPRNVDRLGSCAGACTTSWDADLPLGRPPACCSP